MPAPLAKQIYYSVKIGVLSLDVTGRKRTPNGYVVVCVHGHPNSDVLGYVMEHRLVVEIFIGRLLNKNESVHHKNRVKHDNRISNLEIIDPVEHTLLHHIGAKRSEEARKNISNGAKRRLKDKRNHPLYKDIDQQLIQFYKDGLRPIEIQKELKISRRTYYNKLDYLGLRDKNDK